MKHSQRLKDMIALFFVYTLKTLDNLVQGPSYSYIFKILVKFKTLFSSTKIQFN